MRSKKVLLPYVAYGDGKEFTVPMSEAAEKVTDLLNNE